MNNDKGICKRDNKVYEKTHVCSQHEFAHHSVLEARDDYQKSWQAFSGAAKQYRKDDNETVFCVAINNLLRVAENLHLRSYIHKCGKFSIQKEKE